MHRARDFFLGLPGLWSVGCRWTPQESGADCTVLFCALLSEQSSCLCSPHLSVKGGSTEVYLKDLDAEAHTRLSTTHCAPDLSWVRAPSHSRFALHPSKLAPARKAW